jgi:ribosomal protein L37AE/L43A
MTDATPEPAVPVECPECRSNQLKGPDQPGTGLAYWRCLKCGIVWNPERPPDRDSYRSSNARASQRRDNGDYWKNR